MINDFNLGLSLGFILCLIVGIIISLINYIVELSLIEKQKRIKIRENINTYNELIEEIRKKI